jgi:hypothetical protein
MQEGIKDLLKQIVTKAEMIIIILRKLKEKRTGNSILLQVLCYHEEVDDKEFVISSSRRSRSYIWSNYVGRFITTFPRKYMR